MPREIRRGVPRRIFSSADPTSFPIQTLPPNGFLPAMIFTVLILAALTALVSLDSNSNA